MRNQVHIFYIVVLLVITALGVYAFRVDTPKVALSQPAYAQERAIANCVANSQGDANCDGKINDEDYLVWKSQYKGEKINGDADFNDDGLKDMKDFEIWRRGMFTPTTVPTVTIAPTCVPLPACVNDPENPCAVRPPFEGYYCPPTTPTPTSIAATTTPTPTNGIIRNTPDCSECGYQPLCTEKDCPDVLSCQVTCTVDGASNLECSRPPVNGSCEIVNE